MITARNFGTALGPHGLLGHARPARRRALRVAARARIALICRCNVLPLFNWGSSGRRFKSCQRDAVQRWFLGALRAQIGHRTQMRYPNEISTALHRQIRG